MFQKLVSHNEDLGRLVTKGYAVAFDSNCLVVRDIPYLDAEAKLRWGAIVSKMVFPVDNDHAVQDDHQIFFAGVVPHGLERRPVQNLGGGPTSLALSAACADVVVQRSFSHKPKKSGRYADFFEKIDTYVSVISGPAIELHNANPYTFRTVDTGEAPSVFRFRDTLTSRAEITDLSAKFAHDVVAIIGLGGTGSYVLDLLVKTAVREIRGFDRDLYYVHNAFRSPGRLDPADLGQPKSAVYQARYENFRSGISLKQKVIDASCSEELDGVTFAFVNVDKGSSRGGIFELLLAKKIPFIDVGMGLKRKAGGLSGMLRATYYSAEDGPEVAKFGLAELSDGAEDLYRTNIQIAELNSLNAALAVIRFKQIRGFYLEEDPIYHLLMQLGNFKTSMIANDKHDGVAPGEVHSAAA